MHDKEGKTEWFIGRPYDSSDRFVVHREAALTAHNAGVAIDSGATDKLFEVRNDGSTHDKYGYVGSSWLALHLAAAAACRGSTNDGGRGCCQSKVLARVKNSQSCDDLCPTVTFSGNAGVCKSELTISASSSKATTEGEHVARFYNYQCGGSGNGGNEPAAALDALYKPGSTSAYFSFCCCSPS